MTKLSRMYASATVLLLLAWSFDGNGGEPATRGLRVAFFYNASIFKDNLLLEETARVFTNAPNVRLTPIPYNDSNEFAERCKTEVAGTNAPDIILGPSDSDSLKSLDKSLGARMETPFLAPFVTTRPADYSRVTLISASATDEKRVRVAIDQFAKYTTHRALGCLFTDDPWGQGIAKAFRDGLAKRPVNIFTQPVSETETDPSTGVRARKDNSDAYASFLNQMWRQGARVIAVALLDSKSVNEFMAGLRKLNQDSWLGFQPTILLLNQPTFDEARKGKGILAEYAKQFRIVYVRDQIGSTNVTEARRPILSHLDACNVIAAAAQGSLPIASDPAGKCAAVRLVREFYTGTWDDEQYAQLEPLLTTGFHRSLYSKARDVEVMQGIYSGGSVTALDVRRYFEGGFWHQLYWRTWFFLSHHPSLWRLETTLPFLALCFGSLLHMVWFSAMKRFWLIWRTRSFWLLFFLNLVLTYAVWVISIWYGVFSETDWLAPLLLAGICPSAASAFAEILKRFVPMVNLSGVFAVLNEMNSLILETIGKEELTKYERWLATYPPRKLKAVFQEVLFLETANDALRNRLIDRVKKYTESIPENDPEVDQQQRLAQIYAESLVQLVAYLATSRADLWKRLEELFPQTEDPNGQLPAAGVAFAGESVQPGPGEGDVPGDSAPLIAGNAQGASI